jgi:PAS domain S-box-containing protein
MERIAAMIDGSAIAAVITGPRLPDNPIVACNDAFLTLTGFDRTEILGRNCRFLSREPTRPALAGQIAAAIAEKRPIITEIVNFKRDGTRFRNAVMIVPIFDAAGDLIYLLGSQAEVAEPSSPRADGPSALESKLGALTPRQGQVLRRMIAGQRNKEIARSLGVVERTVKMHRAAMLAALEVKASADAIRLAVEADWHVASAEA